MSGSTSERVALIARVSTSMQAEEGKSIPAQLAEMHEYAERRAWTVVAEFVDAGYSGSSLDRPGIQAMLEAAEAHAFDILLVHELSRLSRSIFDTLKIFEILGRHNIGFASVKEPNFDFSTPAGRLFLTMLAALNQYYLDILKQHVAKSKRQRARQGLYNASIVPYGYRHAGDADTPPIIDPEPARAVRMAFEYYATANYSFQQIADLLNDSGFRTYSNRNFSKDTIDDMLRNRFYTGVVVYGTNRKDQPPEIYPGQHEAIISKDIFDAVQQARKKRRGAIRSYQSQYRTYLLNAVATCDICRRKLRVQATKSNRYYRELSRSRGFFDCPAAQTGTVAAPLEDQVGQLFRRLHLPEDWQQQLEKLIDRQDEVNTLNNRRQRLLAEHRRLRELYIRGHFGDDITAYEQEASRVQRELDALPTTDLPAIEQAAETLESLAEVWDVATLEEQRDLVRLALREVRVDVGQGRVTELLPYPPFIPLFRQVEALIETEPGVFVILWPPDLAQEVCPDPMLAPVTEPLPSPEEAALWPFVVSLPPDPPQQRISPLLSRFLKARAKAGTSVGLVVDVLHPGVPALKLDGRKWPNVTLDTLTLDNDTPPTLPYPDGSISFLHAPFAFQASLHKEAWLEEAYRVLDAGGWWVFTDLMPASMPGHWFRRFFSQATDLGLPTALDTSRLFAFLTKRGFHATKIKKLEESRDARIARHTCYQAVQLGVIENALTHREDSPLLLRLPDEAYHQGMVRVQAAMQSQGAGALVASHFCLVEVITIKPG